MQIGRKYEEKRKELSDKIKENQVKSKIISLHEGKSGFSAFCYFCLDEIKGDLYRVEIRNENVVSGYYLDSKCYFDAWGVL